MSEFGEVMRQWRRMCDAMETTAGEGYGCDICPVNNATDTMGCGAIFDMPPETNWEGMAEKIMRWAADHPEPKPITWAEWLTEMGVIHNASFSIWGNEFDGEARVSPKMFMPVPADIAQKLGIEPKEG